MDMRKVLCICAEKPPPMVLDLLRASGWDVLLATDTEAAKTIQSRQGVQVGLLFLGECSASQVDSAEACLRGLHRMEWVGVLETGALESRCVRELVLCDLFDHHTLPVDWKVLNLTLGHAFRRAQLRQRDEESPGAIGSMGMVGASPAIVRLQQQILKVSVTDVPVLIGGESGSGKELAARAIHQCSRRAAGPFVAVNCGAIAPALIQSELFGHERGSFTGATASRQGLIEAANGGTIFLDEVGDLQLELQTNLLRFLQEHTIHRVGSVRSVEVDARVVAASHMNLAQAVAVGRFREDLFYRLNVLPIGVPPLRERMSDVPRLAQHFFQSCMARQRNRHVEGFSRQATAAMMSYSWPGNVRELSNRVQRALVMTDQRLITPDDLLLSGPAVVASVGLDATRTLAERDAIALTLGRVGRNVTHAARELGVSRMTLYRLMNKHGLATVDERGV